MKIRLLRSGQMAAALNVPTHAFLRKMKDQKFEYDFILAGKTQDVGLWAEFRVESFKPLFTEVQ